MTGPGLRLGAPGVYRDARRPPPALTPVRLDVAGFVGVAPRGPVDVPVPVDRWSDYLRYFGGFEGPGLLPYAVRAFFAQGGTRAHVLRVAPLPRAPHPAAEQACALHRVALARAEASAPGGAVPYGIGLRARDEGSWGGRLAVRWDFTADGQFEAAVGGRELVLPEGRTPPTGSVLRIRGRGLPPAGGFFRIVELAEREPDRGFGPRVRVALLDRPPDPGAVGGLGGGPGAGPGGGRPTVDAEVVTATVTVADADPGHPRRERFAGLGLCRDHPRAAAAVLAAESLLVIPDGQWPDALLPPDPFLTSALSRPARPGADRYEGIGADSFLGPLPVSYTHL